MRYTEEHEWLRADGELVTVGITEHAASQLGDVVYVELPDAGTELSQSDEAVVIESVKAASEILAPLKGAVVEVNEALAENPGLVNEDPLGEAWFFRMRVADSSALDGFMDEAAYTEFVG